MDVFLQEFFAFRERLYHWFFVILLLVSYSSAQEGKSNFFPPLKTEVFVRFGSGIINVDSTYSVYKVFAPAAHLFFFFYVKY